MKRNIIKIIAAVSLLMLFVIGTIVLKMPDRNDASLPSQSSTVPIYTIYEEAPDNVSSILADVGEMQLEFIRHEGDTWTIRNIPDEEVDKTKTKYLAETVLDLQSVKIIDEHPSDLRQYGLEEVDKTITINKTDGSADVIHIGAKSPVGDYYFVNTSVSECVYALSPSEVDSLLMPTSYYTEFERFDIDTSAISAITIKRSDITIAISREYGDAQSVYAPWVLTEPIKTIADPDYVANNLLGGISQINLSSPVTEGDFGFDRPSASVVLTIQPYDYQKQAYNEELVIGNRNGKNVYVLYDGKAYSVPANYLDAINASLLNVVMKTQAIVNISDVESVEFKYRNKAHILKISHLSEDKIAFTLDDKSIDEAKGKSLYQVLIGLRIDGIIGNNAELGESKLSIKYNGYSGADDVNIEIKRINDLDYALCRNGETQFTIRKGKIDEAINTLDQYTEK